MPTADDRAQWRSVAERAEGLCEAARHDPYDPKLDAAMQALAGELAALCGGQASGWAALDAAERGQCAVAHAAVGEAWFALNDSQQALAAFEAALEALGYGGSQPAAGVAVLAQALCGRGKCLVDLQRSAEAIPVLEASIVWYTTQGNPSDESQQWMLSQALHTLGLAHADAGDHQKALDATARAVELRRRLAERDVGRYRLALSRSLRNLCNWLNELGRGEDGLLAHREMVELRRQEWWHTRSVAATLALAQAAAHGLEQDLGPGESDLRAAAILGVESATLYLELFIAHPDQFRSEFALQFLLLFSVIGQFASAGMLREAMNVVEEAHLLSRRYLQHWLDPEPFLPLVADALDRLFPRFREQGQLAEAIRIAEWAVALYRELDAAGLRFENYLASDLSDLGSMLGEVGRYAEGLMAVEEALALHRESAVGHRRAYLNSLANDLWNLGDLLSATGRRAEAARAAEESLALCREYVLPGSLLLPACLNNLGSKLVEADRRSEATELFRESGTYLLRVVSPTDPEGWSRQCLAPLRQLRATHDVLEFSLPLLRLLTEHRELARSADHAQAFLDLQAEVAMRVWDLLATLPAEDGELLDEAVAVLVATLHSPDLARWLEARGSGEGSLARLAELKRDVIEAEQQLAALRRSLPGGGEAGWRDGPSGPGIEAQRATRITELDRQSTKAQALRRAFRDERARLVAEDPRFTAAFEPVGAQALRSIAQHAQGGALLCVLELGRDGVGQPEPSSPGRRRSVAALLHADGRRTQLLELAGANEVAWHALNHRPEALGRTARAPLRGAVAGAVRSLSGDPAPPPITDLLALRMSQSFWTPLQQALQASGAPMERLHVCLHGTMQQLPLALRQENDCPGLHVTTWPGLPYLRRAAMAAAVAGTNAAARETSSPWLVGHDCAWGSAQPLPMVAVEAALLRDLLQRHGQPVQAIQRSAELKGQPSALVACCHGGAEQAQFDHALHLGAEPLTARQIVQDNIGPPLALLPACHAGRTDEDAAGNALGVAAAFMLSGTQVVSASSKAVPDLLQPWLSTLTVWHAMQGLPHDEAATLAREQFARLEFPQAYRSWLQEALPQALATIQPGGEEDPHIRGPHAHLALETVAAHWPWEGDAEHLFHADRARRDKATRSVMQGILRPRGGGEGARALAAEAREMAAFVFVYGVAG